MYIWPAGLFKRFLWLSSLHEAVERWRIHGVKDFWLLSRYVQCHSVTLIHINELSDVFSRCHFTHSAFMHIYAGCSQILSEIPLLRVPFTGFHLVMEWCCGFEKQSKILGCINETVNLCLEWKIILNLFLIWEHLNGFLWKED
jgi:hypothetical protein